MNDTLKAIVKLLGEGKPERRIAAAQVLAELRPQDSAVVKALAGLLEGDAMYARHAVQALAAIGTEDATRALTERLRAGGAEADQISLLLVQNAGNGVAKVLTSVFDDSDNELRGRILAILGRLGAKESLAVFRKAVISADPALADAALRMLGDDSLALPDDRRATLATQIARDLQRKDASPDALAHGLRACAELDAQGARALLLKFAIAKTAPTQARQAALQGLERVELTPAQADSLIPLVADHEMTFVARPAMAALHGVAKWSSGGVNKLKKLLENENQEVQHFALHALRNCNTAAVGTACLDFLLGPSVNNHDAAAKALSTNPAALDALLKAFLKEKDVDVARRLANPLAKLGPHFKDAHVRALVDRAAKQVADGDSMGDITLHVVLTGARDAAMHELASRALKLRRAKKHADARVLLLRAASHGELSDEAQYQLGVCKLLAEARHAAAAEHAHGNGDATMGYFASLVRLGFPLLDRIKKETQLGPDQYLRLGRHFAESVAQERRFGAELLRYLAVKHPRVRAGEHAKNLLRVENL